MFEAVRPLGVAGPRLGQAAQSPLPASAGRGALAPVNGASIAAPFGPKAGGCPCCGAQGASFWVSAPDRFHGGRRFYRLVRCSSCSLVWLQDPPPLLEMREHYGEDYDRAIGRAGQCPRFWAGRRDELLRYKSGGSLLDLGCSSGGFLAAVRGASWELFGIEMSQGAASEAEARCGAHVFTGDILDAPFPPESFDAITCFHVFEHLYQPREVLARVREWLKPGGIFYTMMPNIDSVGARVFGSYWYPLELPRHLFHYSPRTLRTLACSSGLQEVSITTHRHLFVEESVRYIVDDILGKTGIRRTPLARATPSGLPWKAFRKGFRLTVLPALELLSGFLGEGESIFAVLAREQRGPEGPGTVGYKKTPG